jgi:hypothetical protein
MVGCVDRLLCSCSRGSCDCFIAAGPMTQCRRRLKTDHFVIALPSFGDQTAVRITQRCNEWLKPPRLRTSTSALCRRFSCTPSIRPGPTRLRLHGRLTIYGRGRRAGSGPKQNFLGRSVRNAGRPRTYTQTGSGGLSGLPAMEFRFMWHRPPSTCLSTHPGASEGSELLDDRRRAVPGTDPVADPVG